MTTYRIKIGYETEVEADSEEQAVEQMFEDIAQSNTDLGNFISENLKVIVLCGNCSREIDEETGLISDEKNRCERCKNL